MIRNVVVRCVWDDEAGVWFVRESNLCGLVTEASSLDAMRQKLPGMIQDLLDIDLPVDIGVEVVV